MNERAVDVVVVGAGPTGLLLASELVLAGVEVAVVERLTEPDLAPKARGIGALACELLERRGLGHALEVEEDSGATAARRPMAGMFGGLFLIDQALQREPGRKMRGVTQASLERMLAEHARTLGVEIWRGDAVESFVDDGAHVRVDVRGSGGPRVLSCSFLVGCDGGRSAVRKQAGFDFAGTAPTLTGRQGIVELDHPERLPPGWRRTATGVLSYYGGRLSVIEFDRPSPDRDTPLTAAELEDSLRRVSGADVRILLLHAGARWTDHARQATQYQRGRVLLAGDAAHIHSPFGGQGLSLGLLDAANLGWKLAATVRGDAPDGLLDTYLAERHPVAASVLENTRAQLALMRPDPQTSALRQIMADLLTTYPDVNRHVGEMISGVATRYELGVDDDPLVGRLIADRDLTIDGSPTRLYSLMHDGKWLLINGSAEPIEHEGTWAARTRSVSAAETLSMLIRPDGCIAWTGRPGGLRIAVDRWFRTN